MEVDKAARIGDEYQAILPDLCANISTQQPAVNRDRIWFENSLIEGSMDDFFIRAKKIVNDTKSKKLSHYQSYGATSSSSSCSTFKVDGSFVCVNCDIVDILHQILCYCKFDQQKALIMLPNSLASYLCVWSMTEQQAFNQTYNPHDVDTIDKLCISIPSKTQLEITEYCLRYIDAAAELEANLLTEEPGTVASLLAKFRKDIDCQGGNTPTSTSKKYPYGPRFSNTFDPFSFQQLLSCLCCYSKSICSPAELIVRIRSIVEASVMSTSAAANSNSLTFPCKEDALLAFFAFLPAPINKKLTVSV